MKKEDCKFNFEWDYLGYLEHIKNEMYPSDFVHTNWNQTLITLINQTSACIFKESMSSGASTIVINSKLLPIFESIEFYNLKDKILSGRYDVEIDNEIEDNVIYILHRFIKFGLHFVPEYLSPLYTGEYWNNTFIESRIVSVDIVEEYKKGLCGYITIKNF